MGELGDARSSSAGPLAGLRVLEIGQLIAGPFCGQILGDFGAEVIKVERPGVGDPLREWGGTRGAGSSSPWWAVLGRNKKSITANLKDERGRSLIRMLASKSDVVIENFRPGTLERLGLGYEQLADENPELVMVRVSGYGQTGPYSQLAGYGSIGEALGGLRYVTGDPSNPPSRVGVSLGDSLAGIFGALGALMALRVRDLTGSGQVVDSAIYESVLAIMESLISDYDVGSYIRERSGATLPEIAPSNVYPTADSQMMLIAANQDSVFERLCQTMGSPGLASDVRFASHTARGQHMEELDRLIAEWTVQYDSVVILKMLSNSGVPAGRIYTAADMLADPHFRAREAIVRIPHPEYDSIRMQGVAPKLSQTPGRVISPGPSLGESNRQIYCGLLGLSDAALSSLEAARVL